MERDEPNKRPTAEQLLNLINTLFEVNTFNIFKKFKV